MRTRWMQVVQGVVVCGLGLAIALPAASQDRSAQPGGGRPGQSGGGGGRPGSGGGGPQPGGGGARPQPSRPSPGGRPSPVGGRPNPGGGRPQPPRPNPGGGRPQPGRPGGGSRPPSGRPGGSNRPPQWGRPPQNRPSYQFRPNDRSALHRYYASRLRYINRARRPVFSIGGYFPYGDIGYLSSIPAALYGQLPPPPVGYQMGYFDGYVVVYDPLTFFIANVVDLLQ